jgi:hypothetical protein
VCQESIGGARRNRTADKGFADLCLTTWRPRPVYKEPFTRSRTAPTRKEPSSPNQLIAGIIASRRRQISMQIFATSREYKSLLRKLRPKSWLRSALTLGSASCTITWVRALSSAVRAFGLHPKGRPFKSDSAHHCCAAPQCITCDESPFSGDVVQLVRTLPCHGRGREFESRRPRHSFQKSYTDFAATNESAKGHVFAPFLHPFSSIRVVFTAQLPH